MKSNEIRIGDIVVYKGPYEKLYGDIGEVTQLPGFYSDSIYDLNYGVTFGKGFWNSPCEQYSAPEFYALRKECFEVIDHIDPEPENQDLNEPTSFGNTIETRVQDKLIKIHVVDNKIRIRCGSCGSTIQELPINLPPF